MLEFENQKTQDGYKLIGGMDEAGRGPLAGAVYTAICIMPLQKEKIIDGINDSKQLTPQKRLELYEKIKQTAIAYYVCAVDEKEIDEVNILQATRLGMQRCLKNINIKPDYCLVDYVNGLNLNVPFQCIVKGDAKSYNIACASILAKVSRDLYMEELASKYPMYGFDKHKGYPTKQHYQKIKEFGICEVHRKSFLKTLDKHI